MLVAGLQFVQAKGDYTDTDGRHFAIAIHCTDNTASALGEANYAARRTDGTSSHFYCDDVMVVQSLDTRHKAGHAGSSIGNENAICVEITGQTGNSRDWWLANVHWDSTPDRPGLGWVLAQVIAAELPGFQVRHATVAEMIANPKVPALYGHDDMRQAWGHTDHTDPGPWFPWDRLIQAITAAQKGGGQPMDWKLGDRTIREGDQGPDVFTLRTALNRLGFLAAVGDGATSGTYDAQVTAAVKAYQRSRFGWSNPDGIITATSAGGTTAPKIIAEIAALDAATPPPAPTPEPAPTPVPAPDPTPAPAVDLAPVMAELAALRLDVAGLHAGLAALRNHLGDTAE